MTGIIAEGHRGYCARYPENTLISYRAAMQAGVDAFEFDVWLSKDGVPVIMHDGNAYRTCGVDRHLNDMTLEEIKRLDAGGKFDARFAGERVPTLEELLSQARDMRPDVMLGVEIKDMREETCDKTVALLKQYGFFDNCIFYAFNARIIKYLKTAHAARTMGYPDFQMAEFEPDSYSYYDEIGINMRIMRSEIFPIYAGKGMKMHIYCADTEEDVRDAIAHGASLITANEIGPLLKVLKGY
ncbi:MAG: glycerophosphodiester phosphodiesterase [Clostridia bacterium]|nr:glycerophosphodiester phosphodiesterase [Clostridia bacterium]